ncbi:methyl-accepting chemotaxis protein [Herbaspirillum robiniae]|uniref:Methyl-accepting transducer domain-containing protein n=1 Tax=Herbaspirillum robiniae TaxID=2014887 RepID=A0ABX2LZC2_9BURK|nr:methyl-accepting chemotaxis protein [Herbaspirillum robiniae]NUU00939.1 hypothetical protein [Herbaspirillum robiniae]
MFKFRLHMQLLVLTAVPLLGFLALSGYLVRDAMSTMAHMREAAAGVRHMRANDRLISVLQVERGRSNGVPGGRRGADENASDRRQEMMQARQRTDLALDSADLPAAAQSRELVRRLRAQIDNAGLTPEAAFRQYSGLIGEVMADSSHLLRRMQMPALTDMAFASFTLTSLIEGAARERGLLNGVIGNGAFAKGERDGVAIVIGTQSGDERQFLLFATQAMRDRYRALQGSPAWNQVLEMRASSLAGAFAELDAGAWFDIASKRIASLQILQAEQFDLIGGAAEELQGAASRRMWQTVAAAGVAALLTLLLLPAVSLRILRSVGGEPREVAEIARRIARGEFSHDVSLRPGDRTSILAAMHHMADTLSRVMAELHRRAGALSSAAGQLNSASMAIANSTQQQASSIEETSAAMRTVSEAIYENNEHAMQTAKIAEKSDAEAREGCMAMSFTVAAMRNVAASVRDVDEIAYRTNLLALNAGIEAGRAGMEGKGFAVIAGEVRKLAEHAQQAARDVSEITGQSLDTAEKAGEMLHGLLPSITSTAELVGRISATSQRQARDLAQINAAVEQFSGALQYSADISERLSGTASEVHRQAQALHDMVQLLHPAGADDGHAAPEQGGPAGSRGAAESGLAQR